MQLIIHAHDNNIVALFTHSKWLIPYFLWGLLRFLSVNYYIPYFIGAGKCYKVISVYYTTGNHVKLKRQHILRTRLNTKDKIMKFLQFVPRALMLHVTVHFVQRNVSCVVREISSNAYCSDVSCWQYTHLWVIPYFVSCIMLTVYHKTLSLVNVPSHLCCWKNEIKLMNILFSVTKSDTILLSIIFANMSHNFVVDG